MVSVNTFGTPEMQMYEMQPYKLMQYMGVSLDGGIPKTPQQW